MKALETFLSEEQIPWPNLFNDGEQGGWKHPAAVKLNVQAIPATFLVDREGKVLAQDVRGPQFDRAIERIVSGRGKAGRRGPLIGRRRMSLNLRAHPIVSR